MLIFVRVEHKHERKFIEIKDLDSLTVVKFAALVVNKFQIQKAKGKNVYIHDQYDTRVYETEELKFLLQTQLETLILKVKFEQPTGRRSINNFFTSKEIEDYLKNKGGKSILQNANRNMPDKSRRILFNLIVDLLVEKSGLYPNIVTKTSCAKATVALFPMFKDENDSITLLYDQKKDCGYFISILKARRKAANKAKKRSGRQNETLQFAEENVVEQVETDIQSYDEEQAKQDIAFLRRTVYNESKKQIFAQKLKDTKDYRKNLCKDLTVNIVERFPYFFLNTDLILLDFDVRFVIPRDTFLKKWDEIKENIKSVHTSKAFKQSNIPAQFGGEIEIMLLLLQMLPDVPKGKKSSNKRLNFDESVAQFIVFSPPNEAISNVMDKQAEQPYIILKGASPTDPVAYYIVIDREAICVKNASTFAEVVDLFFKIHYTFNLEFHDSLKTLMDFVGHYFYGLLPSFKPTTTMKTIYKEISSTEN